MRHTLETLLAAARAELRPHRTATDAGACARAAAQACTTLAAKTGVAIETPTPHANLKIAVDALLIERILAPLLENACRYARHQIRILVEGDGASILYIVEDDGPGVSPEEAEVIFEPGYHNDTGATATSTLNRVGLGLALARRLARAAGGDVTADPQSRGGGRFLVELPRA
jgi:signal transduction histidine kinase